MKWQKLTTNQQQWNFRNAANQSQTLENKNKLSLVKIWNFMNWMNLINLI